MNAIEVKRENKKKKKEFYLYFISFISPGNEILEGKNRQDE